MKHLLLLLAVLCAAAIYTDGQVSAPQPEGDPNVLSRDWMIAEIAVNNAILTSDKATLRLGLGSMFLSFRRRIAEAMGEIGDEDFVPNLIAALEGNQGIIGGGSEIQMEQADLDRTLINVLAKLTKIRFKTSEKPTSKEVTRSFRKLRIG